VVTTNYMIRILRARQSVKMDKRQVTIKRFHVGSVIYGYDKTLKKITGGYIAETFIENNKQRLTIRWSDPFLAIEYCTSIDLYKKLKSKEYRLG
jgi:hypothetical protein